MITHYGSAYYYGRYDLNNKVVIKESTRSRVVIAKKARDGIAVGDLVQVVNGFAYEKGARASATSRPGGRSWSGRMVTSTPPSRSDLRGMRIAVTA